MKYIITVIVFIISNSSIGKEMIFSGYYTEGFEYRLFTECNTGSTWWVNITDELKKLKSDVNNKGIHFSYFSRGDNPSVLIKIEGIVSDEGQWGHMGRYSHQLEITNYLDSGEHLRPECHLDKAEE